MESDETHAQRKEREDAKALRAVTEAVHTAKSAMYYFYTTESRDEQPRDDMPVKVEQYGCTC